MKMTEREAFEVMVSFLNEFFEETGGDFPLLITDIQLEDDGIPRDPGVWDQWLDAVKRVIRSN